MSSLSGGGVVIARYCLTTPWVKEGTLLPNNMMLWRLIAYICSITITWQGTKQLHSFCNSAFGQLSKYICIYIYIYVIIYIDIFISLSLSIYISLYLHIHHTFYRRTFQCIFTCTVHEARNKQTNQFGSTWGASLEQLQLLHWQFFHHGKMSLAQQRGNGKYGFLMVFGRSQGCVAFFFGSGKFQSKARKRYRKTILDVLCHDTWHPIR